MNTVRALTVQALTQEGVSAFGWMFGRPFPAPSAADVQPLSTQLPAYRHASSDFWHEHVFDPGAGGESEVLWVRYRDTRDIVSRLEKHQLTQQAIVPLTGSIVQVVANSDADGAPDLTTAVAFLVPQGQGLCMKPMCWHATRVMDEEVTCLMLTRRSTTADLVTHLQSGMAAQESELVEVAPMRVGL